MIHLVGSSDKRDKGIMEIAKLLGDRVGDKLVVLRARLEGQSHVFSFSRKIGKMLIVF